MSPSRRPAWLRVSSPEPQNLWIRYAPRRWPTPQTPWVDLSRRRLGSWSDDTLPLERLSTAQFDDVLYLPPVAEGWSERLWSETAGQLERGVPVLVQRLSDESPLTLDGLTVVTDLLPYVLGLRSWNQLVEGTVAVWPLLPGGSTAASWSQAKRVLRSRGYRTVQPLVLDFDPRDLRVLASQLPDERGLELFHSGAPDGLALAQWVLAAGFEPALERPLPRPPLRPSRNVEAAGRLALVGEALHLVGAAGRAGELLRAARFAEELKQDLATLVREGNVSVLPWASPDVERVLTDWERAEPCSLRRQLYTNLEAGDSTRVAAAAAKTERE